MTLLVGVLSSFVLTVIGAVGWNLSDLLQNRQQAQVAADAAALAAIAESGLYGGADPVALARRYAALNGAEVIECRCAPGASSLEVEVSVHGVRATARAAFDPSRLGPLAGGADGLHPTLAQAVDALVAAADGAVSVVSGFRTSERQAQLWAEALARYGSPERADDWVAPPGRSMHERGLAVDLGGDLELAARLVDRLGLPMHRPLSHEPWHFELAGSR